MSNKLLFTAAVAIGGLLTGAVAATGIPAATHAPAPSASSKPGTAPARAVPTPDAHVTRLGTPQTTSSPGTPPINDNYASPLDALSITQFIAFSDNRDATMESGEKSSLSELTGYRVHNSTWVKWKAAGDGTIAVDTYGSTAGIDTSLAVFTGDSLKHSSRIAWNDDSGANANFSLIAGLAVKKGVTYHFQIGSAEPRDVTDPNSSARTGSISMNFAVTYLPPSNDALRNAKTLKGTSWGINGSSAGSTIEASSELVSVPGSTTNKRVDSIWYKWTASAGGTLTITGNVPTSSSYEAVYESSQFNSFVQRYYNPGAVGTALTNIPITAGSTYYFQLGEIVANSTGTFSLHGAVSYTGPVVTSLSVTKGSHKGGKTVYLYGSNLAAVTYLYWDITSYDITKFTVLSSKKIKFTVPAGTKGTRVPVRVYSGTGGNSAVTSATHYSYTS